MTCTRRHVDDPVPARPLQMELKDTINRHSAENGSNTPDHILAQYLMSCLDAFDAAVRYRDQLGRIPVRPGQG